MPHALLTRSSARRSGPPPLRFLDRFDLARMRAHELCGSARRRLALWVAAAGEGPVLWVRPAWHPDRLHMAGVQRLIDPGRLITVEATRAEDLMWVLEEALRAGAMPLVVGELPEPPGLTPVRRLHLAAETGARAVAETGAGRAAPLALLLTPGDGGAAGVESRWHLAPGHRRDDSGWHLTRLRARQAPPQRWQLRAGAKGVVVEMPEAAEPA